jgi:myo-inositol 2-dehydrogenase/D-chiro-inositol 1-dehydrogenase
MANESKKSVGTTRRDFLKVSAAGAAALGGLSLARGAHAAGSEVIKIGMIGCGGRCAGAAAESLQAGPMVKLVAMTDVFKERMEAKRKFFKTEFPKQMLVDDDHALHGFDGYKKVIEAADVVLIACASKFHAMYALAAIRAGKHVFVEKPHAIDPVGCRQMQAACDLAKQKNLSLVSGLQSRFHNGYQECVKRIHDGAIGDVVAAQSMFLRAAYGLVSRDPKLTETQYQFSNWYHFCWLSGDDVSQSLVHNLDRIAWIMKEEMPKWAFGLGGRASSFGEV